MHNLQIRKKKSFVYFNLILSYKEEDSRKKLQHFLLLFVILDLKEMTKDCYEFVIFLVRGYCVYLNWFFFLGSPSSILFLLLLFFKFFNSSTWNITTKTTIKLVSLIVKHVYIYLDLLGFFLCRYLFVFHFFIFRRKQNNCSLYKW